MPWANIEKVLPHVDTMLHDHKLTIPERHKKWTGAENKRIQENFKRAYETFPTYGLHRPHAVDSRRECR